MRRIILSIILITVSLIIWAKTEPIASNEKIYSGISYMADQYGYTRSSTLEGDSLIFDWIDISVSGNALNLSDDSYSTQSLSFDFPFYDSLYQSFDIQSNGSITFHGDYFGLLNTELPNNAYNGPWDGIYMLWSDLNPGTGNVFFQDFGDFCIIEYYNIVYFSGTDTITYEVILYDNGDINILYKDIEYSYGTIGMQNSTAYSSGNGYYDEFLYNGNPTDYIPVDSTVIMYQFPNYDWDSELLSIGIESREKINTNIIPIIIIQNKCSNAMILDINLNIDSSAYNIYSYSDEINVDSQQTVICTLDVWVTGPQENTVYNVTSSIFSSQDENPRNDSITVEVITGELIWERCDDRKTGEHCHATAYDTDAELFYSFGGFHYDRTMTDAVYVYDPIAGMWKTYSNMPQELYWIDASYANGSIYILGGHDDIQALDITLIYDIGTDSFRYGPSMIYDILGPSIVTYKDSLLYCLGGRNDAGNSTNYVQIYDVYNDTVMSGTSMNKYIMRGGAAITDTIIWIIGGQYTDSLYYGIINNSNPTIIDWHQGSPLPASTWANGAGAMKRNDKWYLYMICGYQNDSISSNVWEYDVAKDIWTAMPDYPMTLTRNDFAAVSSELSMIFVSGGDNTGHLNETKQTWKLQWPEYSSIDNEYFNTNNENSILPMHSISADDARIYFIIHEEADVSLDIYNVSGRHIVNIVDGHLNPNMYSIIWNMKDKTNSPLPAGQYFLKLSVNGKTEMSKILYIK